ncbi:MAG: hypothetical protein P2A85_04910 [Microcoleus anatoxicus]|uniref:hypothetical protein n=1 Tax=Microcoleus anatoxicus TaxID=2705319 RepID=UPI0036713FEF
MYFYSNSIDQSYQIDYGLTTETVDGKNILWEFLTGQRVCRFLPIASHAERRGFESRRPLILYKPQTALSDVWCKM